MQHVLVDSSFLFALVSPNDVEHVRAVSVVQAPRRVFYIPEIVLAETAYMVRTRISQRALVQAVRVLAAGPHELISLTKADLIRAASIIERYAAADFDLADASLMALAERMSITHVATYDRRDFGQFKPIHCDFLTLLPE
ncbi:MAG: PIN domain-containing protein [Anaerolineae bacterium]